jgi:hypothetical protein
MESPRLFNTEDRLPNVPEAESDDGMDAISEDTSYLLF